MDNILIEIKSKKISLKTKKISLKPIEKIKPIFSCSEGECKSCITKRCLSI